MKCPLCFWMILCSISWSSLPAQSIMWTVNWSPDGKFIAAGGEDRVLRIFSTKSWEIIHTDTLAGTIEKVCWHPSENLLAVTGSGDIHRIVDMDWGRTRILAETDSLDGKALAWSPDGQYLALAGYEKKITIWKKNTSLHKEIPFASDSSFFAIDWNPLSGNLLALSDYVYEYNTAGERLKIFKHRDEEVRMHCLSFHPLEDFYLIGDAGDPKHDLPSVLQRWFSNHQFVSSWLADGKAEIRNLSWSKKGKKLAVATDALLIFNKKGKLINKGFSPDRLWDADWDPKGKFLVTSGSKGVIAIWSKKGKLKRIVRY